MTRRKSVPPPRVPVDRVTTDRYDAPRRHLERGDEVTVTGLGRCAFLSYTRKDDGREWVDVKTSRGNVRYVRPERIAGFTGPAGSA